MLNGHSVLVVDEASDTEEVLRAVLEPRGLRVDRLRNASNRVRTDAPLPSVVVIDAEVAPVDAADSAVWDQVPQVIIGTARVAIADDSSPRHYLRKPFEYAELVQTIERLIARPAA